MVNLGIGMPEMVANYLPEGVNVVFHSENGIIGMSEAAEDGEENHNHSNAGGKYVTVIPGAMFFDSATSFGNPKILKKNNLPLTAYNRVKWIITELAVIEYTPEGLVLREVNRESSIDEVVSKTEAKLIIPETVGSF